MICRPATTAACKFNYLQICYHEKTKLPLQHLQPNPTVGSTLEGERVITEGSGGGRGVRACTSDSAPLPWLRRRRAGSREDKAKLNFPNPPRLMCCGNLAPIDSAESSVESDWSFEA
ncbi:hypothetical protein FCM35_KLT19738 [Carex littledalei]|uniref:Uncharacterized protein n=1 Tax=Carex littledalei TaxID=544730 RepID=A0A833VDT8_9POAL|nr:hypothetical protein FCM35_KLT19738 [Carex littledalei]